VVVQWGLGQGNNALANFQFGAQLGQQAVDRRDQREAQNSLLALRSQQEERLAAQEARQAEQAQEADRRADLPLLGKLLEFSQDEGTYQQARQVAQQYGIDTSTLPPNFDPAWREQQLKVVQLLQTPRGQEALSAAGKQAVDMGYQPGSAEFSAVVRQVIEADMAQPYMGSQGETRLYTPQIGQQAQAVPFDPNEWEVVEQGGGAGNGTGGFQSGNGRP